MSTNVISLPSPPGTIKGLGEAFKPMLNTGTAKYAISIAVPPGTNGHTPELTLTYDSGRGSGPFGIGWRIGPGPIKRQTNKGLPLYVDGDNNNDDDWDGEIDEPDEIDTFLGPDGEELVELENGTFRAKIENAFAQYRRQGKGWEVHLRDGTYLQYGVSWQARVTDASGSRIYQWFLEYNCNTNGNTIHYDYQSFPGSFSQIYLKQIHYGPGSGPWKTFYFVRFNYEDRPDSYTDYSAGFPVSITKRLSSIVVGIQGIDPLPPGCMDLNQEGLSGALIRRYDLKYEDVLSCSRLTSITQIGSDGQNSLPPMQFSYASGYPEEIYSALSAKLTCWNTPHTVMDSDLAELVDLNTDSLPDILLTDYTGGRHTAFLNLGVQKDTQILHWSHAYLVDAPDGFSIGMDLSSKSVHLADMDGDGKADLVYTSPWKSVTYCRNTGSQSWGHRRYMSICNTAPPAPFADTDVRVSDLDGDKCIDVIRSTPMGYSLWFNRGQGVYSWEIRTNGAVYNDQVIQFSDTAVHLADMNGDKLNDLVKVTPKHLIWCAHMGFGRYTQAQMIPIPNQNLSSGLNGQVERATMEDINGDGLADLVVERATVNTCWVWLNRGQRAHGNIALSQCITIGDMPLIRDSRTVTRWADMNGNGTKDLVYACSTTEPRLRCVDLGELIRGPGSVPPNMLTTINNGLGAITHIQYRSSTDLYVQALRTDTDAWESTLPIPIYVVSSTQVDVNTIAEADSYYTDYDYWSGYYDWTEKEFWGFAREETTQFGDESAPTVYTTSEFHTGDPNKLEHECLKGKVKTLEVRDVHDTLYTRDENTWDYKILYKGIDQRDVAFAYNTQMLSKIYEGPNQPKYLLTTFQYDDWGHVTEELSYGVVGDPNRPETYGLLNDEILAYRTFEPDIDRWMLDLKTHEWIADANQVRQADNTFIYDINGNLLCEKAWLDTEDVNIPVVRNVYDTYGNIVQITNANNHVRTIIYEDVFHTYPVVERIHMESNPPVTDDPDDLVLIVDYQYGFGQISTATDFSGAVSTYDYDCFGRLSKITRPGDAWDRFEYQLGSPVSHIATFSKENEQGDTFDTYLYFDGLGRKLGSKIEAEHGQWRYVDAVSFNQRGLEKQKWVPYFSQTADYEHPDPGESIVSLEYDALDRVIKTTNPDGTFSSVEHEPLIQHLFDENDNADLYKRTPKTLKYDGQERLIEVIERNRDIGTVDDVNEYVTQYQWTTLGDLARIIDAHCNIKTLEYDSLRRRIFMNDPDRGMMDYGYDEVGNLTWTRDAKNQEILYTYDAAERLLTENYLDQTGGPDDPVDVVYHYDLPIPDVDLGDGTIGTATFTQGRLVGVEDLSGREYLSYDARGNMNWVSKHIRDPELELLVPFTQYFSYDHMDRIQELIYPDGYVVTYEYNTGSQTQRIQGPTPNETFITNIDYTAAGQQSQVDYGNGTSTSYTYDSRHRLEMLNTLDPNNKDLLHYTYQYDPVSNITSILDWRSFETVPREASGRNTQIFTYDDLYRLTQVRYSRKDDVEANYGQIDYAYDAIGNMVYKSSPHSPGHIDDANKVNLGGMQYAGGRFGRQGRKNGIPGPHALTGTDNQTNYSYDDNGNMVAIRDAHSICTWDYLDRLVAYENAKNLTTSKYTYDYTGRRIIKLVTKADQTEKTLYPSEYYEIRPGQRPVKYIFSGRSRIARIIPLSNSIGSNVSPYVLYYHTDHLGSSNTITDANGVVIEQTTFYPFGSPRYEEGTEYESAYKFTGKELDAESDLMYFDTRYYDSTTGRFLTVDTLLDRKPDSLPYVYALGNPIKFIDPDGKDALAIIDEDKNTISISTEIFIYGEGADASMASSLEQSIKAKWGGPFEYKDPKTGRLYEVTFTVTVTHRADKFDAIKEQGQKKMGSIDNTSNYIEVRPKGKPLRDDKTGKKESYVYEGFYGTWSSELMPADAPHEFGHFFGLGDVKCQKSGGTDITCDDLPTAQTMVTQKNIDFVVGPLVTAHNKQLKKVTRHEIKPRN